MRYFLVRLYLLMIAISFVNIGNVYSGSAWDSFGPVHVIAQKKSGCISINRFEDDAVRFSETGRFIKRLSPSDVVLELNSIGEARRISKKKDICVGIHKNIYLRDSGTNFPETLGPVYLGTYPIPGAICGKLSHSLDALKASSHGYLVGTTRHGAILRFQTLLDARMSAGKRGKCSEIQRNFYIN